MVRITAALAGDIVTLADVRSERPRHLAAALARHPASTIPDLARRLFALCGTSQAIAARQALGMAGAEVPVPDPALVLRQLAAERITAHLQATFMGWNTAVPVNPMEAIAMSRALAAVREADIRCDALIEALTALGISATPQAGSWGARLLALAGEDGAAPVRPDPLTAADDAQVLAALDAQGEAFAAVPSLPGRRPEVGAAARAARRGLLVTSSASRLAARLAEIVSSSRYLAGTEAFDPAEWIVAGRLGPGTGFCAVETPRGRLHHLVRLGPDGAVLRYLIVAPTEWNFAGDGPFSIALRGLRVGAAARPAIERLAALYDPCVACAIEVHRLPQHDDRFPVPDNEGG
ncbi:nickel-dependent hydrogenase large subunit [Rhodovastum atsumiense]|uniref:nickel-dependent hydrogenase large subunit n=1 Tax=Rhodovastum atsumiense TaxID=504468 RepID=UPI0020244DB3|nr:nickel-dependent hydrogenase large subunit [Rhodovastum atsumiense]